jgi:tyrosyl-tRNA synthetase
MVVRPAGRVGHDGRMTPKAAVLEDLTARGLVQDTTDLAELDELLSSGPATLYCGFDPTADSLHAGNLIGLLVLRRFQMAGHRPLALAGGATGMIGDPSGRSDERNLLDEETLAHNLACIKEQMGRFLDFEPGPTQAKLVDNRNWTGDVLLLDFLRDVGKFVTVNQMVAKESVRSRMESDSGISYTEFSYMLLQANDYAWLHEHEGCVLQVGGSDQWGNITAGIDLIRRRRGARAHGLTFPLMTKADGSKFGKSAGGAIWLGAHRTSPYEFFQYWIQTDDRDVERFLLQLTLLPVDEVTAAVRAHSEAPERRAAQRLLASEMTALVHGASGLAVAEEATEVVFGRREEQPSAEALESLIDAIPTGRVPVDRLGAGIGLVDLLADTGIAASKGEARRTITQGGVTVNGRRAGVDDQVSSADLWHGRFLLVRRGKKNVHLVVAT